MKAGRREAERNSEREREGGRAQRDLQRKNKERWTRGKPLLNLLKLSTIQTTQEKREEEEKKKGAFGPRLPFGSPPPPHEHRHTKKPGTRELHVETSRIHPCLSTFVWHAPYVHGKEGGTGKRSRWFRHGLSPRKLGCSQNFLPSYTRRSLPQIDTLNPPLSAPLPPREHRSICQSSLRCYPEKVRRPPVQDILLCLAVAPPSHVKCVGC